MDDSGSLMPITSVSGAMDLASKHGRIVEFQAPCISDVATPCLHWFQFWPSIDGISEDWTSRMFDEKYGWEQRRPLESISIDDLHRDCRLIGLDEADDDPATRF